MVSVEVKHHVYLPIPISVCSIVIVCPIIVIVMTVRVGDFNVRTDVGAYDYARGLHGHRKRVCTGS